MLTSTSTTQKGKVIIMSINQKSIAYGGIALSQQILIGNKVKKRVFLSNHAFTIEDDSDSTVLQVAGIDIADYDVVELKIVFGEIEINEYGLAENATLVYTSKNTTFTIRITNAAINLQSNTAGSGTITITAYNLAPVVTPQGGLSNFGISQSQRLKQSRNEIERYTLLDNHRVQIRSSGEYRTLPIDLDDFLSYKIVSITTQFRNRNETEPTYFLTNPANFTDYFHDNYQFKQIGTGLRIRSGQFGRVNITITGITLL